MVKAVNEAVVCKTVIIGGGSLRLQLKKVKT